MHVLPRSPAKAKPAARPVGAAAILPAFGFRTKRDVYMRGTRPSARHLRKNKTSARLFRRTARRHPENGRFTNRGAGPGRELPAGSVVYPDWFAFSDARTPSIPPRAFPRISGCPEQPRKRIIQTRPGDGLKGVFRRFIRRIGGHFQRTGIWGIHALLKRSATGSGNISQSVEKIDVHSFDGSAEGAG